MESSQSPLAYNFSLPIEQQEIEVGQRIRAFMQQSAPESTLETCVIGERVTQEKWRLDGLEIVRYYEYSNPATHAACMAQSTVTTIYRPYQY